MARKLFERQAIRRRTGALASGVAMVVYTDSAGTVLADISATSGGSAIAGSTVTTANIAGFGPAALRFYGPPDGTDTLFIRVPSDTSLGVQEIEASTDDRLDALELAGGGAHPDLATHNTLGLATQAELDAVDAVVDDLEIVVYEGPLNIADPRVATIAGDAGNHALAVQRAIDLAQTSLNANSTNVPQVYIPPGEYRWSTTIDWKTADIISDTINVGTRVYWDGALGATVITKSAVLAGGMSFGRMEGINFRPGTNQPENWIDLSAGDVDIGLRLQELMFGDCTGDAIKMRGFVNCHWAHLRFDNIGGYIIRVTSQAADNLGSFILDGFTYDHSRASAPANGMILFDLALNPANAGVAVLKNARVEINTAWTGAKAMVVVRVANAGANPRSLGLALEDIAYNDVVGMSGDVLVYLDTTATNMFPSLVLKNVRQSGLAAIVGGTLSASYPLPPLVPSYGLLSVSQTNNQNEIMASGVRLLANSFGGEFPLVVRRAGDSADRYTVSDTGQTLVGSGGGAADTGWTRTSGGTFDVTAPGGMQFTEVGDPSAPGANRVVLYAKDVAGKTALYARFPTGVVQPIATEP